MADNDHLPQNTHIPADRSRGTPQMDYRRIPPHGDVSPKGDRIWPRPSMTAKVLVYGGTALAAAAATAAGVLAVRKVADLVSGNDALDREADRAAERARQQVYSAARGDSSGQAPRFALMPEPERDEMRTRARTRMREDAAARNRLREQARAAAEPGRARPRPTAPRQGLLEEIETNARRITRTIDDVAGAVGAAVAGFRSVAGQADSLMREFGGAADQLRSFFDRGHDGAPPRQGAGAGFRDTPDRARADAPDDPRVHRL